MAAARETPGNGSISLSTPGSHWHTARKPIEDQLLYYYERIHELNGQLNALCPIHAFPPEVLSKVLLYLAGHYAESPPRLQDWIQVTHVCRYWRAVALGCSTLWARFTITTPRDPEWMAVFLERSKQLPLSVSVSPRHKPYKWISGKSLEEPLSLVLSYLSRIRTLYLTLETMCSPEVLELLDGPAPLLEYLAITEHQSIPRRRATAVSDPLSRLLRRPETARLRHLELQCPVDWTGLSLQGLTRLHVKTPVIATSLSAFLGALAQMPVLEELVTGRAFARGPQAGEEADTSPLPTQAALRTLRTVRIEESAAITICILCSLDTPSLSHVSVDSSSFNSDPTGSYVELVGATAKKVGTLGQLTTLVIGTNLSGQDATGTYVSAYCDVLESQSMDPAEDSTQTWVSEHSPALELYCGPSTITTPFAVLCDLLPMGDVRCIILRGTLPSHELWTNLVRYAPFATELRVLDVRTTYTLPQLLTLRSEIGEDSRTDPEEHGNHYYVLPNLRRLTLDGVYFVDHSFDNPLRLMRAMTEENIPDLVEALIDCFMARHDNGDDIETLRIMDAYNLEVERDIRKLEGVVRRLEWDRRTTEDIDAGDYYDWDLDAF